MSANCYFCGKDTAQIGCGHNFVLVVDMLRDGPYVEPTHPCCWDCFDSNNYIMRSRCNGCGRLRSLLRTANDSMTSQWISFGRLLLCEECKKNPHQFDQNNPKFPSKVQLTEADIEILKKCWKFPDWKTRTKMPNFVRSIDDD